MLIRFRSSRFSSSLLLIAISLSLGCTTLGPRTISEDRYDYITAISDSWKEQMLLNIVKIRYGDVPMFLDVSSVIAQYSLESQLDARLGWNQSSSPGIFRSESLGGSAKYTDRPTITYSPLAGEKFARSLMTPIQPAAVVSLIQAGYPVDLVLRYCVHAVNGIQNDYGGPTRNRSADPQFFPLLASLRSIQNAGALGFRVKNSSDGRDVIVNFPKKVDAAIKSDIEKALMELDLDPNAKEYTISYGLIARDNRDIALLTRSVIDMLVDTSAQIDVPEQDVKETRVNPTREIPGGDGNPLLRKIHIQSAKRKPSDYLTAVFYRGHWFWIDDRDLHSKRLFSFLLFIFALTEQGERGKAPLVTIPTG